MNKNIQLDKARKQKNGGLADKEDFAKVRLEINGRPIIRAIFPATSLLEFIREELGLTGTKKGCDLGDCGLCTVLLDGKPVLSCLMLALDAEDHQITTIEGLTNGGELHPIQEAMLKHGAVQCGYCSPAMVLNGVHLLDTHKNPDQMAIKEAISGTLCRCTGYTKIEKAFLAVTHQKGAKV
ncbi:MAG: (2Fe-2S)-binding protein [Deltaproteobacteria bacterium]|nr:(2Fe-2S)-binding protein [Deltaproteobacteria bacterium]